MSPGRKTMSKETKQLMAAKNPETTRLSVVTSKMNNVIEVKRRSHLEDNFGRKKKIPLLLSYMSKQEQQQWL